MCDCVDRLNGKLAEKNAAIVTNLFGPARTCVTLYKVDEKKRGRLPVLVASHCPFCGVEYPES
jgi:hypothetical protein